MTFSYLTSHICFRLSYYNTANTQAFSPCIRGTRLRRICDFLPPPILFVGLSLRSSQILVLQTHQYPGSRIYAGEASLVFALSGPGTELFRSHHLWHKFLQFLELCQDHWHTISILLRIDAGRYCRTSEKVK